MSNNADKQIISVVSRKGGVGKTINTINMAGQFLAAPATDDTPVRGNNILYLDLDITGTEASVFERTPLWRGSVNIVKYEGMSEPVNLVELFSEYMLGEKIPEIVINEESTKKKSEEKKIVLEKNKINIFSSLLERSSGGFQRYGPEILFDELHSVWFVEMIKKLIDNCFSAMPAEDRIKRKKSKRNNIALLDNSPGYSGLQPAAEDWLTDIGPKCGRFLYVCSLDPQDLAGTIRTMAHTHRLFMDKVGASQFYHDAKDEFKPKSGDGKKFFKRLADTEPKEYQKCKYPASKPGKSDHPSCADCGLCYYRDKNEDKNPPLNNPSEYMNIIINKAPSRIANKTMRYRANEVLKELGCDVKKRVTLKDMWQVKELGEMLNAPGIEKVLKDVEDRMLPFSEYLATIFYKHFLEIEKKDGEESE